ncbi:MAG TPA: lysophospholipid acyltransferase family protein [Dermatophilaceae bacterium]|nr:lysophospholipid acyltransferase family protein [Dermatophilaceae bacterium]
MFYWVLKTVILGPIVRLLFRPWVEGAEHIPPEGAAIFASNHLSFSDSIFLPLVVPRRMTFLAKSDYFTGRGVKGKATAAFFKGVGQLPVDRSGGRAGETALRSGLKVLRRGEILGIYPEGTRSPDGRLYRGKTGVARMALEGRVPVLPVAMIGTDKAQPLGKKVPKIMRIGVRIGKPLDFSRYEGMEDDRFVLRSITDEIMYELMLLSHQEYVDVYAASMKERLLAAARAKAIEVQHQAREVQQQVQHQAREVQHQAREVQRQATAGLTGAGLRPPAADRDPGAKPGDAAAKPDDAAKPEDVAKRDDAVKPDDRTDSTTGADPTAEGVDCPADGAAGAQGRHRAAS